MRTVWLLGIAAAVVAIGGSTAFAGCEGRDDFCVDTNDPDAGTLGNPLSDVTGMLPGQGIVAAGSDPGYVFWDGDSTNDFPLDGYLGLNANDVALISGTASNGRFNRDGGNISPPALPVASEPSLPVGLPEMGEAPPPPDLGLSLPDLGLPLP